MPDEIEWISVNIEYPTPEEWVVVHNPRDAKDRSLPFPAQLVDTPRGYLWRVLTAGEDEIQYAPLNRNCMWARVNRP